MSSLFFYNLFRVLLGFEYSLVKTKDAFRCGLVVFLSVFIVGIFCVISMCLSTKRFVFYLQNRLSHKTEQIINSFSLMVLHNQNNLFLSVNVIYLHIINIAYWYYYILFNKKGSQCI